MMFVLQLKEDYFIQENFSRWQAYQYELFFNKTEKYAFDRPRTCREK